MGSNDYKVYQLNATDISQKIAEYRTGSGITSSPAVADGFVYVTSHDWRFYQLDASDISQLIAMYRSNIMLQNSPAVANGYAYVGISNKLHQFNASDISRTTNIDITPPNVLIASPGNNTYSNGNATISVSASDLSGISSVTFRIKNSTESYSTLCVDTTAPYACLWDTAEYDDSDGYVINVTAKDTKNNQASVAVHLMIDRNIPSSKDLILAYPSGQSSVRSGQVVTASIAALDEDAGIGIVMVDTTYAGSETNATMEHVSGSNASGQWGSWSTNITVTQSETGNYQLPVYITDRATPSNNTRDSDRLYIIVDNDAPGYSEQQHYGPVYSEEEIYFRIKVSDNLASYNFTESYIFSTNMSGSWVNDTRQVITDITEPIIVAKNGVTGNWSYRFYLFDDAGNVNETDVDDFEVYGDRPEFTIKLYSPENSNQTFSTDINFTYIYYNGTAPNCSLYIDSVLNQTVDSPEEGIVLSFEQTLSSGSYEWSVECYDNVSNETKQSSSKFFEIMADSDNDVLPDNTDRLWFDEDDVPAPGVSDLAIGVGEGNASGIYYSGEYEIRLYDSSDLMLNFSHDFTDDVLDLSRIKVIKGENSMIVNLSGQLQAGKKKTIYISDNGFIGLCVKDSEIASINQMSDGCDGASETDMTSCLGGSLTSNGIVCVDEGATIRIENLTHSAVRGTIPETISSSSGRSWDLRRDNCYSNWTCTEWSSCVGGSQTRSCTDVNCGSTYGRPAEIQNCSCVEEWNCGQWSGCSDGMQTRDCTDSNACGTTSSRPNQEQPCQAEISEAVTGNAALQPEDQIETEAQDENSNVWMAIVAILVLGGLIFLFYRRRRRKD